MIFLACFDGDDALGSAYAQALAARAGVRARVTRWTSASKRHAAHAIVVERVASALDLAAPAGLTIHLAATYTEAGALPPTELDDRARGLLIGLTDCDLPDHEAEFTRFYDDVHAREVLDSGLYLGGRRFRALSASADVPAFAALYESEGEGIATFRAFLARGMPTPPPPCFLVRRVLTFTRA